ncbi:von Willebrand factor D and EGF domain-containing protein [Mizuhopecten yessoensis]|uniref:von Willebrand factor D and EGF domain-containing protein n=1 Tax=Mizuhopecten yessoensis TaxID=6573 RepID=A0A210Q5C3_MIZYE|nr:von Willebrand factor D and EGF domain-containing protein [Mizuhopecten yessoensis]
MAVCFILVTYMCILHVHLLGFTYAQADPCVEGQYVVIDDVRRRPIYNPGQLCDDRLSPGWYRFLLNGTDAEIPTACVESKSCGTFAPVWLRLPAKGLPLPGETTTGEGCANYEGCCAFSFPVVIRNCRDFFIYKLDWIYGCPVAYCAYTPMTTCSQGQIYIRHLHSCVDHIVEITKPVIRVRVKGSTISLNCSFHIPNDVIASTSPTFHVVWYKGERGLSSIIRKTFRTETSDTIRVGSDVYAGRSITCAVQPVSGTPSGEITSDPYFLGVKIQDGNVTLTEDGPAQNLTWVSRLPIVCNKRRRRRANSCGANLIFRLSSSGGSDYSTLLFSTCKIALRRIKRCPRNICALDQLQVVVARNLFNLEPEEYDISGDIYFHDGRLWEGTLSKTYITVYDLPSATCFAVSGVQILTFSSRKERIRRRGTYILFQSFDKNIEIHTRVRHCFGESGLCICGLVARYRDNVVVIDMCRQNTGNDNDDDEVDFRLLSYGGSGPIVSNMKVLEGRNNRLIHILLSSEARLRVDIHSGQMGVAVHVSGYYTGKVEGLCGPITSVDLSSTGPEVNRLPAPPSGTNSWRFAPGRSYFDRSPMPAENNQFDNMCDCSLATVGNPCPEVKPFLTSHPFIRFKDVTYDLWNKIIEPPDYRFAGDKDVTDISETTEIINEESASERCGEFVFASNIAEACTDFINEKMQFIIELCISMAMGQQESSWKPNILRLTESICESTLVSKPVDMETNMSRDSFINVTRCPVMADVYVIMATKEWSVFKRQAKQNETFESINDYYNYHSNYNNYHTNHNNYNSNYDNCHTNNYHSNYNNYHPNNYHTDNYHSNYNNYPSNHNNYHSNYNNYHTNHDNYNSNYDNCHTNNSHSNYNNYHSNHNNYHSNNYNYHSNHNNNTYNYHSNHNDHSNYNNYHSNNYHSDYNNYHSDNYNYHSDNYNYHSNNYNYHSNNYHSNNYNYHTNNYNYHSNNYNYHSNHNYNYHSNHNYNTYNHNYNTYNHNYNTYNYNYHSDHNYNTFNYNSNNNNNYHSNYNANNYHSNHNNYHPNNYNYHPNNYNNYHSDYNNYHSNNSNSNHHNDFSKNNYNLHSNHNNYSNIYRYH